MRDDKGQVQGAVPMKDQARSVWSAPRLTVVGVDELTKGASGPSNNPDYVTRES